MKPTYDEIVQWMKDYFATLQPLRAGRGHRPPHGQVLRARPEVHALHVGLWRTGAGHTYQGGLLRRCSPAIRTTTSSSRCSMSSWTSSGWWRSPFSSPASSHQRRTKLLVKKHYLPLYELTIDDNGTLKIKTIRFFWEASPPEVDAQYSGAAKGA